MFYIKTKITQHDAIKWLVDKMRKYKGIWLVLWKIHSRHDSAYRRIGGRTIGQTDKEKPEYGV